MIQQHNGVVVEYVEVRHFEVELARSAIALRRAIERVAGLELNAEAPGMWRGERAAGWGQRLVLTVRASETTEGTQVVLSSRLRTGFWASLGWTIAILPLALFIIPLLAVAAWTAARQERQRRDSEVLFHRIWAQLAARLGAPSRATYRDAPTRVSPDEIEIAARTTERRERASRVFR